MGWVWLFPTGTAPSTCRFAAVFCDKRITPVAVVGRYLFMPFSKAGGSDEGDESGSKNNMVYKRYKLSDEKTFDCYFHEEKQPLLYLVDHFMNKTGKFAVAGYPHKLGLLLHGPPGSGKTSLIKALAHYTKRSIVAVPLAKVKTNQELMDIMFDQSFLVQGEDLPMRLPHSKVCSHRAPG